MIFASYTYLAFLALLFVAHWSVPVRARKPLLIAASYAFYASWRLPYVLLLLGVSVVAWGLGLVLAREERVARWLPVGIAVELAPLVYFKYAGFGRDNLAAALGLVGVAWTPTPWDVVLPLGVSFFSFQGIAYLIDVASGEPPIRSLPDFLLYKAFWPQLIAGPIIRPDEIRGQLESPRTLAYEDLSSGGRRVLIGLLKKVALADVIAQSVDTAFSPGGHPGAMDALAGTLGFGLQIYWDFSGYSDVAIGSARLFGYRFPENFDWPYLARSPQEFWNRWHMTLSRWIRDYVFTPMSFSLRGRRWATPLALVAAMALCGLWHGAAWTFVLWGTWHGALLVAQQTWLRPIFAGLEPGKPARGSARGVLAWGVTMTVVFLGWLLFRARGLSQVREMLVALAMFRGGLRPQILRENGVLLVAALAAGTLAAQLLAPHVRAVLARRPLPAPWAAAARGGLYAVAVVALVVLDRRSEAFVYFQF